MILTCLFKYLNLSKQTKTNFFIGRESKCEQEEDNGSKHDNKRSVNENLHSDESKNSRSKNQLTKYKRVDKARNYPGSMLRPYSSVKHNRYANNDRTNSHQRRCETVCESNDLYDDAFSKIIGKS